MKKIVMQDRFRIEGLLKKTKKNRIFLGWDLQTDRYCLLAACLAAEDEREVSELLFSQALLEHRGDEISRFREGPYQVWVFDYLFSTFEEKNHPLSFLAGKRDREKRGLGISTGQEKEKGHFFKHFLSQRRKSGRFNQKRQKEGKEKKRGKRKESARDFDADLFQLEKAGKKKKFYPRHIAYLAAAVAFIFVISGGGKRLTGQEMETENGQTNSLFHRIKSEFQGEDKEDQTASEGKEASAEDKQIEKLSRDNSSMDAEAAMARGDHILFGPGDLAGKALKALPYYQMIDQEEDEKGERAQRLQSWLTYYQDMLTQPERINLSDEEMENLLEQLKELTEEGQNWPAEERIFLAQTLARLLLDQEPSLEAGEKRKQAVQLLEQARDLISSSADQELEEGADEERARLEVEDCLAFFEGTEGA